MSRTQISVARAALAAMTMAWMVQTADARTDAKRGLSIPLVETSDGFMMTEMRINGSGSVNVLVDTAANFALVGSRELRDAGVDIETDQRVSVAGLLDAQIYPRIDVPRLDISNATLFETPTAVADRALFPRKLNILPASAFSARYLDFDFPNRTLMVYDERKRRGRSKIGFKVKLRPLRGLWLTRVEVNGRRGWALIDTGANATLINREFAEKAHARLSEPENVVLEDANHERAIGRRAYVHRIEVGDSFMDRVQISVADPSIFEHLGLDEKPAMVLGLDYLKHFRLQIDQRNNVAVLIPSEGVVAESERRIRRNSFVRFGRFSF